MKDAHSGAESALRPASRWQFAQLRSLPTYSAAYLPVSLKICSPRRIVLPYSLSGSVRWRRREALCRPLRGRHRGGGRGRRGICLHGFRCGRQHRSRRRGTGRRSRTGSPRSCAGHTRLRSIEHDVAGDPDREQDQNHHADEDRHARDPGVRRGADALLMACPSCRSSPAPQEAADSAAARNSRSPPCCRHRRAFGPRSASGPAAPAAVRPCARPSVAARVMPRAAPRAAESSPRRRSRPDRGTARTPARPRSSGRAWQAMPPRPEPCSALRPRR